MNVTSGSKVILRSCRARRRRSDAGFETHDPRMIKALDRYALSVNRHLVEALAAAFMGVENASDDDVDPDWAVKVQEGIAHPLLQFSEVERSEFTAVLADLAEELGDDPFYRPWRTFYLELPSMIWGD